jgi:hypothetical protein
MGDYKTKNEKEECKIPNNFDEARRAPHWLLTPEIVRVLRLIAGVQSPESQCSLSQ